MRGDDRAGTGAEAYLARLAQRGIEVVFANAGTDFAPIIEALAGDSTGTYPRFITVPHENLAMAMAHGYYRLSGKPAAVMVHVTVGTANALCGLINAARDNVPVLLAAGRTPLTETGHAGSRNRAIHWGQETFDQGGMVREYVKWDYELRAGQPVASLVDRALDIAMSEPRGPVYLTLPREVLAERSVPAPRDTQRPLGCAPAEPSRDAIVAAARLIADAELPLIITASCGRTADAFAALSALAAEFALPVVQSEARDLNLATDHPMHLGYDPSELLPLADVVLVIDAEVPWLPRSVAPASTARIVHVSADPLATRYPYRGFDADVLIAGETRAALVLLREALRTAAKDAVIETRRQRLSGLREQWHMRRRQTAERAGAQRPIGPACIAACLNAAMRDDAVVVNELGLPVAQLDLTKQGSYIGPSLAGGLGFGLGAALGAKLAAPGREVIAVVGDGSYLFGNPLPFHYVARAENLATLTIVANNQAWHAVRRATLDIYPDGKAAKANAMALVDLKPSPDFEKVIETCGGIGERVEDPAALPAALQRALDAVRAGTPALLNVITQGR